jgi:hypothetical protein
MATLTNLVSALAHVTGLPEATVFAYGRFARQAGLISQGGRGLGGAQMTATDATNLLFAVCGTRVTRDAGKAISALRPLPGEITDSQRNPAELQGWTDRFTEFAAKQSGEVQLQLGTFVDYLIYEACGGNFEALIRSLKIYNVPGPMGHPDPQFEEAVETFYKNKSLLPIKKAEAIDVFEDVNVHLGFSSSLDHVVFAIDYNRFLGNDSLHIRFGRQVFPPPGGDLSTDSSVTQRTILAIGACLGHAPKNEIPHDFSGNGDQPIRAEGKRSGKRRVRHSRAP